MNNEDNERIQEYLEIDRDAYINRDEYNLRDSTNYVSPILEDH